MDQRRGQRHEPHAELSPWVTAIVVVQSDGSPTRDALYAPRTEASILARWDASGNVVVSALGPLSHARRKSFSTPRVMVQVLLRAGRARALLGMPIHELTDHVVPIENLWGDAGSRLRDRLAVSPPDRATDHIQVALVERLRSVAVTTFPTGIVARAMVRLDGSVERVGKVAEELGVSDRHLRRRFLDDLGMTPKHYGRVTRLRRVLAGVHAPSSWIRLALDAGFHDQSHMIREFRDLLHMTPERFRRRGDLTSSRSITGRCGDQAPMWE